MRKASSADRDLIIDILARSFADNKSINFIVRQDARKQARIRSLMGYCFDTCLKNEGAFLSDDNKACALVRFPDKHKRSFSAVLADLRLITRVTGLKKVRQVLRREAKIKNVQPKEPLFYLWYIGVAPENQHQGAGSRLLEDLIRESRRQGRMMCLETSVLENVSWYRHFGFEVYHELYLTYKIFFLSRVVSNTGGG